jgi:RNA polymerase sigma factor (sigma-70 family)
VINNISNCEATGGEATGERAFGDPVKPQVSLVDVAHNSTDLLWFMLRFDMLEDAATRALFRRGDRATLAAVYRKYAPIVEKTILYGFSSGGYAFPGLVHVYDQQNALQEVFVRAFADKTRASFGGDVPFEAFLRGIARNVMFEMARQEKRAGIPTEIADLAEIGEAAPPPSAEELRRHKELCAATRTFVGTLPQELRTVVALRFDARLPQVEVARRMGLSRQNVRTLEARVARALYEHLRATGIADPRAAVATTLAEVLS